MKKYLSSPVLQLIILTTSIFSSFYIGTQYASNFSIQSQDPATQERRQGQFTKNIQQRNGRFSPTVGSVVSIDASTMTISLDTGGSRVVLLSPSTQVSRSEESTITSVKIGDMVSIFGQQNADGSVTAQRIDTGKVPRINTGRQ